IAQMGEDFEEAAEVDRVLGETAAAIDAQQEVERTAVGEAVGFGKKGEIIGEARAIEHFCTCQHAGGDEAQTRNGHAAGKIFGENREAFLRALITGKAGAEEPKAMARAIEIG